MLVTYVFQQTNKKLYTFNALPLSDFQLEKPCFDVPGFPAAAAKTYPLTHNLLMTQFYWVRGLGRICGALKLFSEALS